MSSCRDCLAALRRAAPVLILLSALPGCTPGRNQFAPACPEAALLPQAADFHQYRSQSAGGGHDLTDLVLQGRVLKVDGRCEPGRNARTLNATVTVTMEVTRGPAAPSRTANVSYFVAVVDGDRILDKRVFTDKVAFPGNIDRVFLVSDPVAMQLPVTPEKTGAAYTVWAGFQLTPAEMAQGSAGR
ncbi:MAG TPA: hypothetical protein VLI93_06395 [Acetobacteraceae bacterium]|nr:hypothetical protein [Acetobacteraceae bacterium]